MTKKIQILTKDNCPGCKNLKMFLEVALQDKYKEHIEYIHKETNPAQYQELVEEHDVLTLPVLIAGEEVQKGFSPSTLESFIQANIS